MSGVELRFLGSGDAFGSGGRFQACMLLGGAGDSLLVDCGTSSLIAMKKRGLDPSLLGSVLISHLHGDHFGGLPFLVLDGQFSHRESPLLIAGPPSTQARVEAAMEALFPGSSDAKRHFETEFLELDQRVRTEVGATRVTAYAVEHASGAPAYAYRIEYGDKVLAYSGDTQWSESLVDVADGADLFVCEAYFFEKKIRFHLDFQTLATESARLNCRRIVLTHMSHDMLSHLDEVGFECAEDGLTLSL